MLKLVAPLPTENESLYRNAANRYSKHRLASIFQSSRQTDRERIIRIADHDGSLGSASE